MSKQVFLSYARNDRSHIPTIKSSVERSGRFCLWHDEELRAGEKFPEQLVEAIRRSFCLILLVTDESLRSEWVKREYKEAINAGHRIIPIFRRTRITSASHRLKFYLELSVLHGVEFNQAFGATAQRKLVRYLDSAKANYDYGAQIVSFVNFKGGVGKTTLCSTAAIFFTHESESILEEDQGRNVLVVDLDPQRNLSLLFLSRQRIQELQKSNKTALAMFEPKLLSSEQANVSDYSINLCPVYPPPSASEYRNHICQQLIGTDFEDEGRELHVVCGDARLMKFSHADATAQAALEAQFLYALTCLKRYYNIILIDCGPSASLLNRCTLRQSDLIVAPVRPDDTAGQGLALISEAAENMYNISDLENRVMVIFNMIRYRGNGEPNATERNFIAQFRGGPIDTRSEYIKGNVANAIIPYNDTLINIEFELKKALKVDSERVFGAATDPIRDFCKELKLRLERQREATS